MCRHKIIYVTPKHHTWDHLCQDVRPLILRGHMYKLNRPARHHITDPMILCVYMFRSLMIKRVLGYLPSRALVFVYTSWMIPLQAKVLQKLADPHDVLPKKQATYSSSMENTVTMGWTLDNQLTGPPAISTTQSEAERRVSLSLPIRICAYMEIMCSTTICNTDSRVMTGS